VATMTPEHRAGPFRVDRSFLARLSAGTSLEAIGGVAAIVLSAFGLAGFAPLSVMAIATIVVGAAFLIAGVTLAAKAAEIPVAFDDSAGGRVWVPGGLTVDIAGGLAGVVLGVLALIGIFPINLVAVAALVFGATFLLGRAMTARLRSLEFEPAMEHPTLRKVARETTVAATGVQFLLGLVVVVLGILALVHIQPQSLALVAILVCGASLLLDGSAMTTLILAGMGRRNTRQTA
jgi:hypothetical protein